MSITSAVGVRKTVVVVACAVRGPIRHALRMTVRRTNGYVFPRLIVADNGSDMYVTGTMDARWNNSQLNPAFASLTAGDFDVVQLGWR